MNSSESMNCAAASVAFLSPSRSSASSRISRPPAPSFVASNAACSRSCSAVSRVSSAWSVVQRRGGQRRAAPLGRRRRGDGVVQRRTRRDHDRRLRVGRLRAPRCRPGPVPASPVPHVPSSSHCALASSARARCRARRPGAPGGPSPRRARPRGRRRPRPPLATIASADAIRSPAPAGARTARRRPARPGRRRPASACIVTISVSISFENTCSVSGVAMTTPSTSASPTRGTASTRFRFSDESCAIPTSSIRSRLTTTKPQPSPTSSANGHHTPSAMCTANAIDTSGQPARAEQHPAQRDELRAGTGRGRQDVGTCAGQHGQAVADPPSSELHAVHPLATGSRMSVAFPVLIGTPGGATGRSHRDRSRGGSRAGKLRADGVGSLTQLTDGDAPQRWARRPGRRPRRHRGATGRPVLVHGPTERTGTPWL